MDIFEDRYGGVIVDQTTLPKTINDFFEEMEQLLAHLTNKKLVWVKVPIERAKLIPVLTRLGFIFHHCTEHNLMLVKKMQAEAMVPTAQNYTVGVGAIIRDGNKLLVIKDRFSKGYKLPGGHIDNNETIKEALKREVYEETGVIAEFESIVNIGHFTQGQFGESNLYIVCSMKIISKAINIQDTFEILEAKWMDINEFLNDEETNNYNRSVVQAFIKSNAFKLIEQKVQLRIPGEVFY